MFKKLLLISCCLLLASCEVQPEDYAKSPWQTITSTRHMIDSYRMAVPHGWLVLARLSSGSGMAFVPDEKHEWKP